MKRIAVVDDSASERIVLKGFIEAAGFACDGEGANGLEAVEICRERRPDLLIMDLRMPVKDGLKAAEEINRICPTPIVLLTADEDGETARKAALAGVMGYLVKPVRAEEIAPVVEVAVTKFNELKALKEENDSLKKALEARKIIAKAKGLLMEKENLSERDAFGRIRKISMDKRKGMAEIAEVLIMALEKGGKI
ncbi:MAG: response regulator [Deltaproteobacteria bacterium]|nr:response regulator [Deltaproteobacteria bacterium]MCL4873710.1 response regulator [bacterium]